MNGQQSDVIKTLRVGAGISITEGVAGLAAMALTIIGLAHVYPWVLGSIAAIALGTAFAFEAGAIVARFTAFEAAMETRGEERTGSGVKWATMSAEFLLGCGGITLGILALLDISPMVLVPITVLIFGAALIVDSGARLYLRTLESRVMGGTTAAASAGVQMLAGLGAIALGIIALVGVAATSLSLVGLLAAGTAVLIIGPLVGGRVLGLYRKGLKA